MEGPWERGQGGRILEATMAIMGAQKCLQVRSTRTEFFCRVDHPAVLPTITVAIVKLAKLAMREERLRRLWRLATSQSSQIALMIGLKMRTRMKMPRHSSQKLLPGMRFSRRKET